MSAQPTPGEWFVDEPQDGDWFRCVITEESPYAVCQIALRSNPHAMSDARLMASAKDLLAVARMVIRSNDADRWGAGCQPIVEAAHAAVQKATGETP
ncbi:MAG TPA: hypothetical protein PLL92_00395 [Alicycliphilus sp.]|nr:hypothetical protein [Alicycliphilus sp.]